MARARNQKHDTAPRGARPARGAALAAGAVALLAVAAHLPALRAGFIWDDDDYIVRCSAVRAPAGLWAIWTWPGATPQYYPLTFSSFWLEHRLWGLNPAPYHVLNIALHAANAALVFVILRRLGLPGAWLAAALFAVHPVHVESVAWIAQRKNTLSALFYLLAALMYLRFDAAATTPASSRGRWRAHALALVFFTLAMLAKTANCALPAALLLVLWWQRGRVRLRDIWALAPLFAIGIALSAFTWWMETDLIDAFKQEYAFSPLERILIAGRVAWFYFFKLLWPVDLSFVYARWHIDTAAVSQYAWPAALVAVLVMLVLVRRRTGRGPLTAVLFYLGSLLPVLGFLNFFFMRYSFVADHFQYIPSLGIFALAAALAVRAARAGGPAVLRGAPVLAALLLLVLGAGAWRQTRIYRDHEVLWGDVLRHDPDSSIGHYNLAMHLKDTVRVLRDAPPAMTRDLLERAAQHFAEAARVRPDDIDAWNNLANLYVTLGRLPDALRTYEEALRRNPNDDFVHYNVAQVYAGLGRLADAEQHLQRALAIRPDFAEARQFLAQVQQLKQRAQPRGAPN